MLYAYSRPRPATCLAADRRAATDRQRLRSRALSRAHKAQLRGDAIEHRRRRRAQIAERRIADNPTISTFRNCGSAPNANQTCFPMTSPPSARARLALTNATRGACWRVRPAWSTSLQDRNADRFEKSGRHDVELRGEVTRLRPTNPIGTRPTSSRPRCRMRGRSRRIARRAVRRSAPGARVIVQAVVERAIAVRAGKRTQPRAEDLVPSKPGGW